MALKLRETSNHLILSDNLIDCRYQKPHASNVGSTDQVQYSTELGTDVQMPIDYTPSQSYYRETATVPKMEVGKSQLENCAASSSGLSRSKLHENGQMGKLRNSFVSSWEEELGKVEEINDDTFLQSIDGICQDLKSFVKAPIAVATKKSELPQERNDKKCEIKKTNKRKCRGQANFCPVSQTLCQKNVGAVYRQNENTEFGVDGTVDCSLRNGQASIKLASFAQTFQHLKQRNF